MVGAKWHGFGFISFVLKSSPYEWMGKWIQKKINIQATKLVLYVYDDICMRMDMCRNEEASTRMKMNEMRVKRMREREQKYEWVSVV